MMGRRLINLFIVCSLGISLWECSPIHNTRATQVAQERKPDHIVTFMTYNIRMGGGTRSPETPPQLLTSSKENLEDIVAAIISADPDCIALQEVGGYTQAKYIASRLNMNWVYLSHGNKGFEWGLAILSKFTILQARSKAIMPFGSDPRIGLQCKIEIKGREVSVFNIHYHLGAYEAQVDATMDVLRYLEGPIALLGDFNREIWAPALNPILRKMLDTCFDGALDVKKRGTFFFSHSSRIDHIFVDSSSFEVKEVGLIPAKHWRASDHIAYFARVSLRIE